jgi:hypothetical protein
MMLREMDDAIVLGDLHVQRQAVLEAVLPIDLEAQEIDVELAPWLRRSCAGWV